MVRGPLRTHTSAAAPTDGPPRTVALPSHLTAAGRRLLPYAERILDLLAEAQRVAKDDGEPAGALTLGSLESTAALRLAPVLSAFVAAFPKVDLVLRTGTTAELIEAVCARRLEGAFVCGPIDHGELDIVSMFTEELVLLAAPGIASLQAALAGGDTRIVVLKAGCSYRQRLETILAKRGVQTPRRLEFGTVEAIRKCVGAGLGITLLPRSLVEGMHPKTEVSVQFTNRAGLSATETVIIQLVDPAPAGSAAAKQPEKPQTTIEGTVVEGSRLQPNLPVRLVDVQNVIRDTVTTDAKCKFLFKDVAAGAYRVMASKSGSNTRGETPVQVQDGQKKTGVEIKLTR